MEGRVRRIGQTLGCKAVVVVFLSTECPISNECLPALNGQETAWRRAGVELFGVVSDPNVTRAEAVKHRSDYAIRFPVLFDSSGQLRALLEPTHTPEAFVLSPELKVLYRGRVDDRYAALGRKKAKSERSYVRDAVDAVLDGKPVAVARVEPVGCLLELPAADAADAAVTYCRDIAPILAANCVVCHRQDGSAPFTLTSYDDASKRAQQLSLVTHSHQMPPWKPMPGFGKFRDERRLTDRELSLIERWADTGAARGHEADLPPMPSFATGWTLGKPDLVLEMPEAFELPAGGDDVHRYFVLPTGLRENRLVSAVEFRPGNPKVVHHASFYLDTAGAARALDERDPQPGFAGGGGPPVPTSGTLRSWLPGFVPQRLPQGTGRILPEGTDLIVEIHYHPGGKPETDRSTVGLYYAPRSAKQLVGEVQVLNYNLAIPPGDARHSHQAAFTLPVDATLLDCAPHMHQLGREMKVTATRPDGTVEPLVWITDWNYRWQGQFLYADPVRLPKGTRIELQAWYDNSDANPLNPHSPPQTVRWGQQSSDEMGIFHFQYTCDTLQDMHEMQRHSGTYTEGMRAGGSAN